MIFDAIVVVIRTVLEGILGLLPAVSLPSSFTSGMSGIGSAASKLNGVLPVVALGVCIVIVSGTRALIALWGLVVWVYDKFPFKAT